MALWVREAWGYPLRSRIVLNPTAIGTERSGRERASARSVLFMQKRLSEIDRK